MIKWGLCRFLGNQAVMASPTYMLFFAHEGIQRLRNDLHMGMQKQYADFTCGWRAGRD